jgi:hypothetical protein
MVETETHAGAGRGQDHQPGAPRGHLPVDAAPAAAVDGAERCRPRWAQTGAGPKRRGVPIPLTKCSSSSHAICSPRRLAKVDVERRLSLVCVQRRR